MSPEELYSQQQRYVGSGVARAINTAREINAKNAQQAQGGEIMADTPSQLAETLSAMNADTVYKKKVAAQTALQDKREAILNSRAIPGENIPGNTEAFVMNGQSGPGTRNQVKNVTLYKNDPKAASIERIANENLKYSQGRGQGCTDCSAFTQRVMKETYGKNIGGNTETQWKHGNVVAPGSQRAGDTVFFKSPKSKYKNRNVTHVGFVNGDGTFTDFGIGGLRTRPLKGYSLPIVGYRRHM